MNADTSVSLGGVFVLVGSTLIASLNELWISGRDFDEPP
jgi:hypothetical protein